jgi:monothiol glutaredoxin
VFIDGEFVGGCDILRQMHSDGELEKALKPDAK